MFAVTFNSTWLITLNSSEILGILRKIQPHHIHLQPKSKKECAHLLALFKTALHLAQTVETDIPISWHDSKTNLELEGGMPFKMWSELWVSLLRPKSGKRNVSTKIEAYNIPISPSAAVRVTSIVGKGQGRCLVTPLKSCHILVSLNSQPNWLWEIHCSLKAF